MLKLICTVSFTIEVLEIEKPIPDELKERFSEWLKSQAVEFGTGKYFEHFAYSENQKDDIGVRFIVST